MLSIRSLVLKITRAAGCFVYLEKCLILNIHSWQFVARKKMDLAMISVSVIILWVGCIRHFHARIESRCNLCDVYVNGWCKEIRHPSKNEFCIHTTSLRWNRISKLYSLVSTNPKASEICAAVAIKSLSHSSCRRSAGAEMDKPAIILPLSSWMPAAMQRTPSSNSSLSRA